MPNAFIEISATGGYIGRIYWTNSGVHSDFPRWGSIHLIPAPITGDPFGCWAGTFPVIRQIINWRFYEND